MKRLNRISAVFTAMLILPLLTACSGTGESGNSTNPRIGLSALVLPEQVSVVDPQGSGGSNKPIAGKTGDISPLALGAVIGDLPATSDYVNDRVSVYVNERSLESFRSVNEILCMVSQSRYDDMLNQGPYRAQVDKNLCSGNRSDASNAGQSSTDQSSGASRPQYEEWVVDSSRASAQSPHIVKVWVHSEPNNPSEPDQLIYAKLVITEGADTAPPYGIFTINFKAFIPPDLTTVVFKGFLNAERDPGTGKVLLKFSSEDKDSYAIEKATLDKAADGSGGAGSVFKAESFPGMDPTATRFNLAYDTMNFLRTENSGTSICLDRKSYEVSTWKYALYTATTPTGKRVKVNSGFPVMVNNTYGWVGYWGSWFPAGVTLSDGDTVYKHDYATNTDTPFTIVRPGGKLKKHTKKSTTLGGIKSIPLVWWDNNGAVFLVAWDSPTKSFYKLAQQDNNGAWKTISPDPLDLTALPWVELGFWSQSLGGMTLVKFPPPLNYGDPATAANCGHNALSGTYDCSLVSTTLNDAIPVVYYSENIVYPTDTVPATLACFENCPDATTLSTAAPFRTDVASYQSGTSPALASYASYSFNTTTMVLTDASTAASIITAVTDTAYQNGITSGPLVDPVDLSLLACDWDANSTCAGKAWTVLQVFYTWETGQNEWNQFTGLKDAIGNPVKFDPPLQVQYVHQAPAVNPTPADSKYDGTTFFLEYNGFGDLQGIPGMCVNLDSGATNVDCSLGATDRAIRWVPEFNIPNADGSGKLTEVTSVATPSIKYFVKALEKEERMKDAPGACLGLTTTGYTLPSMSSWINPLIGPEPVVNDAPAVVGGVVQ